MAQVDTVARRTLSTEEAVLVDAVVLFPSTVVWILNHELGHYTIATLGGAENARLGFYRSNPLGGGSLGWMDWDNKIPRFAHAGTMLGGVAFSRGLAEGLDVLARKTTLPRWSQAFVATTFLLGRFDFARYVFFDALHEVVGRPGSDIDYFVTDIAGQKSGARIATYAVLLGLATVDLICDWDRICVYWRILGGDEYPYKTSSEHASISVSPCFVAGGVGVHLELIR